MFDVHVHCPCSHVVALDTFTCCLYQHASNMLTIARSLCCCSCHVHMLSPHVRLYHVNDRTQLILLLLTCSHVVSSSAPLTCQRPHSAYTVALDMFTCGLYQHVSNMLICRTQIRAQITPRPHSRSRCVFVMKMMKSNIDELNHH